MQYFDLESKLWKPLSSIAVIPGADTCVCAEPVGNNLYVAANDAKDSFVCCYNVDKNLWEKLPRMLAPVSHLCRLGDYMYAISSDYRQVPQRYSFARRQWQSIAKIDLERDGPEDFTLHHCSCSGAVRLHSKLYVMYHCQFIKSYYECGNARTASSWRYLVYCFDKGHNQWQKKASIGEASSHFGSCIFVVNKRLYFAGSGLPVDDPTAVEVYGEQNGEWCPVDQNHIPPNNLGAVEIEGRVYFIINKFPVDSGIRIPRGEVYPVCLGDWENIGEVGEDAALCYLPLKGNTKD